MATSRAEQRRETRQNIRGQVEDALEDRFVSKVYVNALENLVVVEFGGQYSPDTAAEIAYNEVAPALNDTFTVDGFVAPTSDVDCCPYSHRTQGLHLVPLHGQQVHDKTDIRRHTLGLVAAGLEDYLDRRHVETNPVPSTYGVWDDEFADDDSPKRGHISEPVLRGPEGVARDENAGVRYAYLSRHARAAVRILDGPGRFDADEYAFHVTVPFGVVEGPSGAVVIAPICKVLSDEEVESPAFTYQADGVDEFELVRGGKP